MRNNRYKTPMKLVKDIDNNQNPKKVSDKEAEEAFKNNSYLDG